MATWQLFNQEGQPAYYQEGIGWGTPQEGDFINQEGQVSPYVAPSAMRAAQGFGGIQMNRAAMGGMTPTEMGQTFGMPYFTYQNNQWTPGWGSEQEATTPLQQQLLSLMPSSMQAGGTLDPINLFGSQGMAKQGAELALALHNRFGNTPGVRNPVEMAQEFASKADPAMGYTWFNAPGLTFQQVLRDYLGQQPLASQGISYDALNQGGRLDSLVQSMNAEGISNAFKRNEAGKKSGFGGMVKGWASSPGAGLMLIPLGGVLGHAFNPAVSGPMSSIGQAVSNMAGAVSGATSGIPSWLKNPLMSAGKAMLTGGNPLTAALGSGIGELGSAIGGLAEMPQLGRFVANQGYGMYRGSQAASRAQEAAMRRYLSRRTFPQRRLV